jgi:hypothetical protein
MNKNWYDGRWTDYEAVHDLLIGRREKAAIQMNNAIVDANDDDGRAAAAQWQELNQIIKILDTPKEKQDE